MENRPRTTGETIAYFITAVAFGVLTRLSPAWLGQAEAWFLAKTRPQLARQQTDAPASKAIFEPLPAAPPTKVTAPVWLPPSPAPAAEPQRTFHGYRCTGNCSGHQAGYEWGRKRGISNPSSCTGNSRSFIEGCRAYAEE
jgi:hypothetical protein